MESKNNILNQLKLKSKPSVPKGFFENFKKNLQSKIDFNLNDNDDQFEIPKNFFSEFRADLDAAITNEKTFISLGIVKSHKPKIDENFKAHFKTAILSKTTKQKSKSKIIYLVSVLSTAAAAVILLLLNLYNQESSDKSLTQTINTISIEDTKKIDSYVAYVDESMVIDYILEEDIDIQETYDDAVLDYLTEDAEDFYIDL